MGNLKEKILVEFENIEKILLDINELLLNKDLSKHEINSCAYMLINFYNGIENILTQIIKEYGIKIKESGYWHKKLLEYCHKNKILTNSLYDKLIEYMKFRHYAIHNYTFTLKLELFFPLLKEIGKVYSNFKKRINKIK